MGYWGLTSFLWDLFQWFFQGDPSASNCGFSLFPSLGLKALAQSWNFDFSLSYVGVGKSLEPLKHAWTHIAGVGRGRTVAILALRPSDPKVCQEHQPTLLLFFLYTAFTVLRGARMWMVMHTVMHMVMHLWQNITISCRHDYSIRGLVLPHVWGHHLKWHHVAPHRQA